MIENDSDIVERKKNKPLKHRKGLIIGGVISSLIAGVILNCFMKIWQFVRSTLEWLWGLIMYRVTLPIWALLLVLALFAFLTVGYIKQYIKGSIKESLSIDSMINAYVNKYTEDNFFDALWSWIWRNSKPQYLRPYCPNPNCDTPLVCQVYKSNENVEYELFCETCGYKTERKPGNLYDLENKVLRQIERKVRQKIKEFKDNAGDKG